MTNQFADINGTQIHYELRGDGPAVTLIHAGIANLNMWDDQMDAFSANHRTLRYDVRGWGETADPSGSYRDHDELRQLLHHLEIERTAIVGCSGGGKIALDFALVYPEMVSALVLVGPGLGGYEWTFEGFAEEAKALSAAYKAGDKMKAAELQTQIWVDGLDRSPQQVDSNVRQRAYEMVLHTFELPEGDGERLEPEPPAISRLSEIQVPTQIIVGEYDVPDIQAICELLEAKLPLAEERTIMPGTAHLPNMERPSTFNKIVLAFLGKIKWHSTIYAILPHEAEAKVWLEADETGYSLPYITMPGGLWDTTEAQVQRPLRHKLGDVRVLYRVHFQQDDAAQTTESVFVLDNVAAKMENGRWFDRQALPTITLIHPDHKRFIETTLQEWETGIVPVKRPLWARRGWYAQAEQWIQKTLKEKRYPVIAPLEIVRNWCLSYVLRARTTGGEFYFKTVASLPLFVNESVFVTQLAQLFPGQVLAPLAIDAERDWMLQPPLPQIVNRGAPLEQRKAILSQFARMQITAVSHLETLQTAGCHDRQLAWMQTQIEPLFTAEICQTDLEREEIADLIDLIPHLQVLCTELAEAPVPQTLVHGDLHGGNVGLQNGEFVYFDWTDACISHPFFDLLDIFFEEDTAVQTQLRDAYLNQWTDIAPMPQLLKIWPLAEVGAALHHAISYWQIVAHIEPHAQGDLGHMIPFWLRKILTLARNLEGTDGR